MRKRLYDFFIRGKRFQKEFRRQMRMLLVITFSFTIAFTWRQTIFDLSEAFVQLITHVQSSALSSILTSTFITLISLVLIYVSAHFLKEGSDREY
jgi:hypothetical protein